MSCVVVIAARIAFDTTACDTDVISPTPSSAPVTVPLITSMRLPPTSPTACSAPVIAVATAVGRLLRHVARAAQRVGDGFPHRLSRSR